MPAPPLSHLSVLLPPQRLCPFAVGPRVPSVGAQDVMKMLRQAHDGYVNHTLLPVNLPANGGPTPVQPYAAGFDNETSCGHGTDKVTQRHSAHYFSAVLRPFSAVFPPFLCAVRRPGAETERTGEKWRKMGEIWGRNGRETAVAEWRWTQHNIYFQ